MSRKLSNFVAPLFQPFMDVWIGIKNDAMIILADPALDWKIEILFAYPGFWALFWYRITHLLFVWHFPLLPRIVMGIVRLLTAIDIHPGAKISKGGVFIDHGAGVVIGATSEIGAGTTVYHQVTLGASGKPVPRGERRHPIVGNGCVLGAGSKLIGAIQIGDGVITGANSVVTKSVEPNCTAVGVPARSRPNMQADKVTVSKEDRTTLDAQSPTSRIRKSLTSQTESQVMAHPCPLTPDTQQSAKQGTFVDALSPEIPLQ